MAVLFWESWNGTGSYINWSKIINRSNVYTFLKANIASLSGSALDFLIFAWLDRVVGINVLMAAIVSNLCGGILNFLMSRTWVFGAAKQRIDGQAVKYTLVWTGNFILNTGGVYLLVTKWGVHDLIAKVSVAVLVGVSYNYLLQKRYVFANN